MAHFQAFLLVASLGFALAQSPDAYQAPDNSTATPTSSRAPTIYAPVEGVTQTSLIVPTVSTTSASGEATTTTSVTIGYSPVAGHTQSSLALPEPHTTSQSSTVVIAPIVVTAHTDSELDVPTRGPTTRPTNVPRPVENPDEEQGPEEHGDQSPHDANPDSPDVHEGAEPWSEDSSPTDAGAIQTPGPSPYPVQDGASAVTISGTTYSLAPSDSSIYINGAKTTLPPAAATDDVAEAVASALGYEQDAAGAETATSTTVEEGSTFVITPSAQSTGRGDGSASATTPGVAQQTENSAGLLLPGVGMGVVGFVFALM